MAAWFLKRYNIRIMPFASPEKNIAEFGLQPGMIVADLGAGNGDYSLSMAGRVAPGGKVYAIDIQKDLLIRLKGAALERGILNLEVLWSDVEIVGGTRLADQIADLVLVSNLLFQLDNKYSAILEAKRILKPDGRLVLIDWSESFGGLGPQPEQVVNIEAARKILAQAGLEEERSFLAGDHHYGLVFKKM